MNRFEATLLDHIRRREDDVQGGRILVACSGGGDSTALLLALHALRKNLDLELMVAHADHRLRPGSEADAAFVGSLCRGLDLDLVEARLDVEAHARGLSLGLETAARELRWAWLKEEALSSGPALVATGHTLDDHTETVFLRLARGGGSGSVTPLPARQDPRWSPLIQCRRAELRDYLRAKRIPWQEDPTNEDPFTPRNRWRKLLQPLRGEAPTLDASLWETHQQVRELLEFRDGVVAEWRGSRWETGPEGLWLVRSTWDAVELRWALSAGMEILGWAREAAALRDLADWLGPRLQGKARRQTFGSWVLTANSSEPKGWILHQGKE